MQWLARSSTNQQGEILGAWRLGTRVDCRMEITHRPISRAIPGHRNGRFTLTFFPMVEKQNGDCYTLRDKGSLFIRNPVVIMLYQTETTQIICIDKQSGSFGDNLQKKVYF